MEKQDKNDSFPGIPGNQDPGKETLMSAIFSYFYSNFDALSITITKLIMPVETIAFVFYN